MSSYQEGVVEGVLSTMLVVWTLYFLWLGLRDWHRKRYVRRTDKDGSPNG